MDILNSSKTFLVNLSSNTKFLRISIAILFILVLLLIFHFYKSWKHIKKLEQSAFSGMWIAPENFTKKAEIDGMMVYIGPVLSEKLTCSLHRGYLLMWEKDKNYTQAINIEKYKNKINIEPEDDSEEILPEHMQLNLQIENGWMQWYDEDDEIYAELYKDNFSSMI